MDVQSDSDLVSTLNLDHQVDENDHNLASDNAQGGPNSPEIAWH